MLDNCAQFGVADPGHYGRNIPAAQLEAYREATENYRRFMALVDEYVELTSERTAREIAKETKDGSRTGK